MNNDRHCVKRAIIIAAGVGKRMQPLTFEIPKPLVKINGIRMIDTIVNGLRINGINEIYVVVGYLKEQFYEWAIDQKGVQIIENPYYNICNNISSLYVARNFLSECMILDGDQIINNPSALAPDYELSGYNAVWCDEQTNEWLMTVENGVVKSCSRTGGSKGWQLYSISRWSKADGEKLRKHLELEFESGNTQIYWDDVVMFCHFEEYSMGIREMRKTDVVEIDRIEDLAKIDPSYRHYLASR